MNNRSKLKEAYSLIVFFILVVMILCVKIWDLSMPSWIFAIIIGLIIIGSGIVGIRTKSILFKNMAGNSFYGDRKMGYYLNLVVIALGIFIIILFVYLDLIKK